MKTIPISKPYNVQRAAKEVEKIINEDWISSIEEIQSSLIIFSTSFAAL